MRISAAIPAVSKAVCWLSLSLAAAGAGSCGPIPNPPAEIFEVSLPRGYSWSGYTRDGFGMIQHHELSHGITRVIAVAHCDSRMAVWQDREDKEILWWIDTVEHTRDTIETEAELQRLWEEECGGELRWNYAPTG